MHLDLRDGDVIPIPDRLKRTLFSTLLNKGGTHNNQTICDDVDLLAGTVCGGDEVRDPFNV